MADLTEYVDAAARAQFAHDCPTRSFDALSQLEQYAYRLAVTPIVAAVAPLIERDAKVAALEEAAEQLQSGHRHQPTEQGDPAMTQAIFLAARSGDYIVGNAIAIDGGIVYANLSVPVSGEQETITGG